MSLLQIALNVLLSLILAFVAGVVLVVYMGRISQVAARNAAQHEEMERHWHHLKRLLPGTSPTDSIWSAAFFIPPLLLYRSADPGELFLPAYASDTDALLALARRPGEAVRFAATTRRLRRRSDALTRAEQVLDEARRTIDEL